jgi:hypothetical protein
MLPPAPPSGVRSVDIYFDPLLIRTFADLITNLAVRAAPHLRQRGLANYLRHNVHTVHEYRTLRGDKAYIYIMHDADCDDHEFHTAEKLAKAGYHVLFPGRGDMGKGRKNDVFLYDIKTFVQLKVELKVLFGQTVTVVASRIRSGAGQANIIAYDIQSNIRRDQLIAGLRNGWSGDLELVMLHWHGRWYRINAEILFTREIFLILK